MRRYSNRSLALFFLAPVAAFGQPAQQLEADARSAFLKGLDSNAAFEYRITAFELSANLYGQASEAFFREGDKEKANDMTRAASAARHRSEIWKRMEQNRAFDELPHGLAGPGFKIIPATRQPESSAKRWRIGASLGTPFAKPGPALAMGSDIVQTFEQKIFSDPGTFELLLERLGGEFFPGPAITGQLPDDVALQAKSVLAPGIHAAAALGKRLEIALRAFFFKTEWSGQFPVTVFPFNSAEPPKTVNGEFRTSASGIWTDLGLSYLFPTGAVQPFAEAGIRSRLILRTRSEIILSGVAASHDLMPVSNALSPFAAAGITIRLRVPVFVRTGISYASWADQSFSPGVILECGWRF